eukprot:scaffold11635_cov107-Isochrysis_galbana.AAC.1
MAGLLCPPAVRTLPFPSPILSPSLFPCSGRYKRGSCVHYNSLGSSIESLGFIVVLKPMSASNSTSLRADYG